MSEVNEIVRKNLMTRPWYTPYCGASCHTMPRTKWDGSQFVCPDCGWRSQFPEDFIAEYREKWGMVAVNNDQRPALAENPALHKEEMDRIFGAGCGTPGCNCGANGGDMFLHGRCHMDGNTETSYCEGVIKVACKECGKLIARIAVAE